MTPQNNIPPNIDDLSIHRPELRNLKRVNVTKTFLPPIEEYEQYLQIIWQDNWLTNHGPLLKEFEKRIGEYLEAENLHFVTNGTIALQIALQALDINDGEVITTPFSYVATTSAILWQRCKPVFVDIDPKTLCIDANKIEAAITPKTKAIMPVHVFGIPCDVEKIDAIARKHKIKVIYDGAHAFGVKYNGKSLLNHGDISICSFHSTKLFHTIEGGAVIAHNKKISDKVELIKRFGHNSDDHYMLGINAKASEFQAAMGLCNLKYVADIINKVKKIADLYDQLLDKKICRPVATKGLEHNHGYYPVILPSEENLMTVVKSLNKKNIFPRRYFYPSLNTLPYIKSANVCPIAEDISKRIMCLPVFVGLEESIVEDICKVINR